MHLTSSRSNFCPRDKKMSSHVILIAFDKMISGRFFVPSPYPPLQNLKTSHLALRHDSWEYAGRHVQTLNLTGIPTVLVLQGNRKSSWDSESIDHVSLQAPLRRLKCFGPSSHRPLSFRITKCRATVVEIHLYSVPSRLRRNSEEYRFSRAVQCSK